MNKKLYWGLAILIILLIGTSVFMRLHNTDTEPDKVYKDVEPSKVGSSDKKLAESKNFTDWWEENGATLVSDDKEQVKSNMPDKHEQAANKFPDWHSLTPEQQKHIYDQFYVQCGVPPPPKGYEYRWKDRWVPLLDENGNPVLHKIGDPIVEVRMGVDFAPTKEEYEEWKALDEAWGWAEARGDIAEAKRLKAERDALEASAQRMRPIGVGTMSIGREAKSKSRSFSRKAYNDALREHGLEHLISPWD